MPEGTTSIADMVVKVDGDIESLKTNMTAARDLVAKFAGEGTGQLQFFDAAVTKVGAGVELLKGKLGVLMTVIEMASQVYGKVSAAAEKLVAEAAGAEEAEKLAKAFVELKESVGEGAVFALMAAGTEVKNLGMHMLGLQQPLAAFNAKAAETAETLSGRLIAAMAEVSHQFRTLAPITKQSETTIEETIERLTARIEQARELMASGDTSPVGVDLTRLKEAHEWANLLHATLKGIVTTDWSGFDTSVSKSGAALKQFFNDAIERWALMSELQERAAQQWVKGTTTTPTTGTGLVKQLDALDEEIRKQKLKNETLGMGAAASRAYAREQEILAKARESGGAYDGDVQALRARSRELERVLGIQQQFEEQQRDQKQREAAASRADRFMGGQDRELLAIREKIEASKSLTREQQAQLIVERELQRAKQGNIHLTVEQVSTLWEHSLVIADARDAARRFAETMSVVDGVGQLTSRALGQAFSGFARGTIKDFGDVQKAALDLARSMRDMLFQRFVADQLVKAITGGIASAFQPSIPSSFSIPSSGGWTTTVSGARADGGPVDAGKTYLVGERGAELFTPDRSGMIWPNGATPQAAPQYLPAPVAVNITAPPGTTARETGRRDDGSGGMTLDILIEQLEGALGARVAEGQGSLAPALQQTYGLSSAAGAR